MGFLIFFDGINMINGNILDKQLDYNGITYYFIKTSSGLKMNMINID